MLFTFFLFVFLLVLILLYVYKARLLEAVTRVAMAATHHSDPSPASAPAPTALRVPLDKKDELVGWARKFSLFPYPFVTACCAMEFMAVSSTPYDTDRFGAALPRFSPRQSDLLMVVGTVTHKQAPILLKVYEQMCEPKWVMAFGAARRAAASTRTTPRCWASTRSSRSTSTSPAARRGRRR